MKNLTSRFGQILLWSVLAAAFIGPGTLATASAAGSNYGFKLVWALIFSTIACIIFQEMTARITIVSGQDLITILKKGKISGLSLFLGLSVILGCGAYEAGNILGAISGISLLWNGNSLLYTALVGLVSFLLLWFGSADKVARFLGFLVLGMTALFLAAAFSSEVDLNALVVGSVIPQLPVGSELIVLGLVGTTIVPYNLFLGSGLGKGQSLSDMRFGLTVSIILGGIISVAILVVGTQLSDFSSFQDLARHIRNEQGFIAFVLLALGLFSAGLTSSITAPLAAALIGKYLFTDKSSDKYYRLTWVTVLGVGLVFGLTNIKPLPVIILAQALNGLVLPMVAMVILIYANDSKIVTTQNLNPLWLNLVAFVVLNMIFLIGMNNVFRAGVSALGSNATISDFERFIYLQIAALPFLIYAYLKVRTSRKLTME